MRRLMSVWYVVFALGMAGCVEDQGTQTTGSEANLSDVEQACGDEVSVAVLAAVLPTLGDPVDIYYPAKKEKKGSPVVVLLQGANVDKQYYSELATAIAERKYIVMVPNHFAAFPPPGGYFTMGQVATAAFAFAKAADLDETSVLYKRIDETKLALVGHSFGGVAGLFAIDGACSPPFCAPFPPYARPAELKAGVFYGTNTFQGQYLDVNTSAASVALIQGSLDGNAPAPFASGTYALLEPSKALITINGANHFGIANVDNPAGAKPDASVPTLDQETAVERVALMTILFLNAEVKDSKAARTILSKTTSLYDGEVTLEVQL